MWEELENALAWYKAAPARWIGSAKKDLEALAEWIWVVLQGDFAEEEQSVGQIVTGTVISMIPFVDQLCDVRDVVANSKKINQDSSNKWAWVALVLTLIGLFPTLGSLVKGCFKVLFAYGRKAMAKAGAKALDSGVWTATKPWVEAGIVKLNEYLARPEFRKALAALKIDAPYKYLAKEMRTLAGKLNTAVLMKAFDEAIKVLKSFADMIQKWGSAAMKTQAGQLLEMVTKVRHQANRKLGEVLKPVQDWLNKLAQRLDVEHRLAHPARTNSINPHAALRPHLDAEIEAIKANPPKWVDAVKAPKNPAIEEMPLVPERHFDIGASGKGPVKGAFETFHTLHPDELPPGTVIYRVLDPKSVDNSICWMTKAEFDKLKSKDDWRRRFAVWANWNANGEFTRYVVPQGKPLKVWRGETASQQLRDSVGRPVKDAQGNELWLEGGAEQLVVNPKDLRREHLSPREFTGWSYDSFDVEVGMVGVPILQTNWRP